MYKCGTGGVCGLEAQLFIIWETILSHICWQLSMNSLLKHFLYCWYGGYRPAATSISDIVSFMYGVTWASVQSVGIMPVLSELFIIWHKGLDTNLDESLNNLQCKLSSSVAFSPFMLVDTGCEQHFSRSQVNCSTAMFHIPWSWHHHLYTYHDTNTCRL